MVLQAVGTGTSERVKADDERVTGAPGAVRDDDPLECGQLVPNLEELGQLGASVHEACLDLGVAEDVGDLRRCARRVDGHRHAAVEEGSKVREMPFHPVGRQDRDPPTRVDSEVGQPPGDLTGSEQVLSPGQDFPIHLGRTLSRAMPHRRAVRESSPVRGQRVNDRVALLGWYSNRSLRGFHGKAVP